MLLDYLNTDPETAARRLLGCQLVRGIGNQKIITRIVETEAYDRLDPASHSFKGITKRNEVMFGPAGFAYVYFTYGMHHCLNVVVGPLGHGSAVLIRAVEPHKGWKLIRANRQNVKLKTKLTNGPGKVCQALNISRELNGHDLSKMPLKLVIGRPIDSSLIASSERIGISIAKDVKWRFYIKDNVYVSKSRH